jgi:hypothetical protein
VDGTGGTHERGEKSVQSFGGKAQTKETTLKRRWEKGIRMDLRGLAGKCTVDSVGSGLGTGEHGDETSGSGATELVS